MVEPRAFQRGGSLATLPILVYLVAGMLALNGVSHLFDRQWLWGALDLVVAVGAWADLSWSRRTPILSVSDGVLVIRRHLLARPQRFAVDAITTVDDTQPGRVQLALQGEHTVAIRLDWFAWGDRAPVVAYLKSIAVRGSR